MLFGVCKNSWKKKNRWPFSSPAGGCSYHLDQSLRLPSWRKERRKLVELCLGLDVSVGHLWWFWGVSSTNKKREGRLKARFNFISTTCQLDLEAKMKYPVPPIKHGSVKWIPEKENQSFPLQAKGPCFPPLPDRIWLRIRSRSRPTKHPSSSFSERSGPVAQVEKSPRFNGKIIHPQFHLLMDFQAIDVYQCVMVDQRKRQFPPEREVQQNEPLLQG